jgi:hypothetical protein
MKHAPQGISPIQAAQFRYKTPRRHRMDHLPELQLVCGRDDSSSGIHAWALLPNGGEHPSPLTLLDYRWRDPIVSLEEIVVVTIKGLLTYAREAGYDLPGL